MSVPVPRGVNRFIEPAFAFLILWMVAYSAWFLITHLYLPQPFFFNPNDFQMDWYNTSYYAHHGIDAYDSWKSVYPPLSFVFLKVFGLHSCYEFSNDSPATLARDCDWLGFATLHAVLLANAVIAYRIFRKRDPHTALYRTIATALGMPMLFGWERGNLVVVAFTFFALAYGNILRSARLRWLMAALAINFKPYLIVSMFVHLGRRQLNRFVGTIGAVLIVYLATWGLFGSGSPSQLAEDSVAFAGLYQAVSFLDLWYPTSYIPVLSLFMSKFPSSSVVGSDVVEWTLAILPVVIHLTQAGLVAALVLSVLAPGTVETPRLVLLAVLFSLITNEAGGYTQIYLLLLVFMERWRRFPQKAAIVLAYVLAIPGDIVLSSLRPLPGFSYWAQGYVWLDYGVAVGHLVRPALVLLIGLFLSWDTLQAYLVAWREGRPTHSAQPAASP